MRVGFSARAAVLESDLAVDPGKRIEHGGAGREPWRGVDGCAGVGHRHRFMGRCGVGCKVLHANTAAAHIRVPHDFLGDGAFIEIPWAGLGEAFKGIG